MVEWTPAEGLFVIVAVAHVAIVDPVLRHSVLLRVALLIVAAAGIVAYLYREPGGAAAGLSRKATAFFVVRLGGILPVRSGDNGRRGKIGSCATFERVRPWASCRSVSPSPVTNACWD
jgi:hypothetical protein